MLCRGGVLRGAVGRPLCGEDERRREFRREDFDDGVFKLTESSEYVDQPAIDKVKVDTEGQPSSLCRLLGRNRE